MKKAMAFFLCVVMTMAMGVSAFADGASYTISTQSGDTHTYEVYQILTGDLSTDGTTLSNVAAGQNFKGTDAAAAAEALGKINANASDSTKLATIKEYVDLESAAFKTMTNGASVSVPAGYYLIKDVDDSLSGKDDAYTTYIVSVVKDTTISRKADKPKVQKKVKDVNDTKGTTTGWQDSADADVGDKVDFQLTATLPENEKDFASYKSYKLKFHDVESEGLTFDPESVVVKYGETTLTKDQYTLTTEGLNDGCTFEVTINDVKSLAGINVAAGGKFYVEYKSTLNEKSVIGSQGNPNEVYLEYSNNPNQEGEGTPETGKTPHDKVIVFTYQVDVNKVTAGDKTPLAGATFALYKKVNGSWTLIDTIATTRDDDGKYVSSFKRVDDGDYKLVETVVPDGYNKIDDVEFTIDATHDETADSPTLLTLNGGNKFTGNVSTGVLSADIENSKGATLPSTGGMGTTLFYVVGGLMMAGAAVLLVTKKRMA